MVTLCELCLFVAFVVDCLTLEWYILFDYIAKINLAPFVVKKAQPKFNISILKFFHDHNTYVTDCDNLCLDKTKLCS